jgi:hypothetical protein
MKNFSCPYLRQSAGNSGFFFCASCVFSRLPFLHSVLRFVVVRDLAAKNMKQESVQLVPEIVEALTAHRPTGCAGTDLVSPKGIPRARRLTLRQLKHER